MSNIYTRVHNKKDTHEQWSLLNPILHDGEIVVVDEGDGTPRYKIGDGITDYNNLPFIDDDLRYALESGLSQIDSELREDLDSEMQEVDSHIKDIREILEDKADDHEIASISDSIKGILHALNTKLPSTMPAEKAGMLLGVNEIGHIVPTPGITIENIEGLIEAINSKVSSVYPIEHAGKVLGIDEYGNIVPMKATIGGSGSDVGGGMTWGDLKNATSE